MCRAGHDNAPPRDLPPPEEVVVSEGCIGQEQLNEITKRKQPLVIKKRGNYASISGEFTT